MGHYAHMRNSFEQYTSFIQSYDYTMIIFWETKIILQFKRFVTILFLNGKVRSVSFEKF